jgi:N-methylhydantoinase B
VIDGKVSAVAARADYGVVVLPGIGADSPIIDEQATKELRQRRRTERRNPRPIIDRGEGFERMQRGEVKPWARTA